MTGQRYRGEGEHYHLQPAHLDLLHGTEAAGHRQSGRLCRHHGVQCCLRGRCSPQLHETAAPPHMLCVPGWQPGVRPMFVSPWSSVSTYLREKMFKVTDNTNSHSNYIPKLLKAYPFLEPTPSLHALSPSGHLPSQGPSAQRKPPLCPHT